MHHYPAVLIIRKGYRVVNSLCLSSEKLYDLCAACCFDLPLSVFLALGNVVNPFAALGRVRIVGLSRLRRFLFFSLSFCCRRGFFLLRFGFRRLSCLFLFSLCLCFGCRFLLSGFLFLGFFFG